MDGCSHIIVHTYGTRLAYKSESPPTHDSCSLMLNAKKLRTWNVLTRKTKHKKYVSVGSAVLTLAGRKSR